MNPTPRRPEEEGGGSFCQSQAYRGDPSSTFQVPPGNRGSIKTSERQICDCHSSGLSNMGQEDGEWSQVTRKRGRKPITEQSNGEAILPGIRPNPSPELTIDEVRKYHETVVQEWQKSGCWQALQKSLLVGFASPGYPPITTAICLGPGPFDPANGSLLVRRTAHMQTAAFDAIVANLGRALAPIPCPSGRPDKSLTTRYRVAKRTSH